MSTATPPTPPVTDTKRLDWQRKVNDPLEKLRGYIRLYVSIEGAAFLVIYLALWFWIGLLLDYGFFKVFTVDWVQQLPRWFRGGVLGILTVGLLTLLTLKVTRRLLREFSDVALALVLERRFPKVLGDRLITAVELADPHMAAKYGYSQAMIDQTVADATVRLDQVPVKEAFDWRRLRNYVFTVLALTAGMLILTGAGYCAINGTGDVGDFATEFGNVSAIWFERNILLENTIWPRRAHLELVGFPDSGELKVGRSTASAPIRVRALKWVYADRAAPEGWRSMHWSEVTANLLGYAPPDVPREWFKGEQEPTVDQVELALERSDVRQSLAHRELVITKLPVVFDQLKKLAAMPAMARTMRMLDTPDTVMVYYNGDTVRSEMTLQKESDNEYSGLFTDLKETVRFQCCAADYCTAPRTISVVPPPALSKLLREEDQPAYLFHRAPVGKTPEFLQGKKQHFPAESVYLGGETSRIDVPSGTDVKLIAIADKDLDKDKIVLAPRNLPEFQKTLSDDQKKLPVADAWAEAKRATAIAIKDPRTFEISFANVTSRIDFEFQFIDTDGVSGKRHVTVQPADDVSPEVEVMVAIVRKTPLGYMITPAAAVPFDGTVRDDHGLDQLQYVYSYNALESSNIGRERAFRAATIMQLTPDALLANPFIVPTYGFVFTRLLSSDAPDEKTGAAPVFAFAELMRGKARQDVGPDVFQKRLKERPPADKDLPLVRNYRIRPDVDTFDLLKHLPEMKASNGSAGTRYRLNVRVRATDNHVEDAKGPHVADSKEQFNFIVVSEAELLAEIAKEEETLHIKLGTAFGKIKEGRTKLDQVENYLRDPKFDPSRDYDSNASRSNEIAETLNSTAVVAREVWTDYSRIFKEMETNRIQKKLVSNAANIVGLLNDVLNNEFGRAEDAQRELQRTLEKAAKDPEAAKRVPALVKVSQERLDELIAKLKIIVDAMGDLTVARDLIVFLQSIDDMQRENNEVFRYLQKRLQDLIFGD